MLRILPVSLTCPDKNPVKALRLQKAGIHKITAHLVWYSCDPLTSIELSDISTDVTLSFLRIFESICSPAF